MNLGLGLSLTSPRGAFFTPAALANILRWYRSDAANVSLDGSNNVSQWNDLVGSAHLIQGTAGSRPAYNATDAGYGGKPTLQSAGSKSLGVTGLSYNQPISIWVVGEASGTSGTLCACGASGGSAPALVVNGLGNFQANAGSGLQSVTTANPARVVLATFNHPSNASFIGVSNWLTGGVASTSAGANNGTGVGAFAYSNGAFSGVGKLAEFIIQSGAPTAAEKAAMAAYFTARYGITIT